MPKSTSFSSHPVIFPSCASQQLYAFESQMNNASKGWTFNNFKLLILFDH